MSDKAQAASIPPKAEALRSLPPEWRERLIESAAEMGIAADHDVGWLIVRGFVNAWAAAAAAGEAAVKTSAAIAGLPEVLHRGVCAAGNELVGQISTAGQQVLEAAAQAGHAELAQAVQGLGQAGVQARDEMIAEWRFAATQAARETARAAWVRTRAQAWVVALGGLLLAAFIGAAAARRLDRAREALIETEVPPIVAWARTAAGRRVYVWSWLNAASLNRLLACTYPGWIQKHQGSYTICYPNGHGYGYYLPPP